MSADLDSTARWMATLERAQASFDRGDSEIAIRLARRVFEEARTTRELQDIGSEERWECTKSVSFALTLLRIFVSGAPQHAPS